MFDDLRAFAVIIALGFVGFAAVRRIIGLEAMSGADFSRRRNAWFAIITIAYLAHNFWLYIIAVGLMMFLVVPRDGNRPAFYFLVLFALPPISAAIPGIGIIQNLFVIDYIRLLALTVLLPLSLSLRLKEASAGVPLTASDRLLLVYLALNVSLEFVNVSFTGALRSMVYSFTDIVLPYYVISRSLRSLEDFRDALASLVASVLVLAVIGIFEAGKGWLLYRGLEGSFGLIWDLTGGYVTRGESLRAMASTGQPIVLGYVMTVAFGLYLYVKRHVPGRLAVGAGFGLLMAGEIVPISRGPWIGALVAYVAYAVNGARPVSFLGKRAGFLMVALPILAMTPLWSHVVEFLPFVGSVDAGNVDYRERLLDLSLDIILANPFFGSADYSRYLEELRQGQGIIDIVNTYLVIALNCGLVGLSLFLGFFGTILAGVFKALRSQPADSEIRQLGQALFGVLVAILVMIFSVSPITFVPVMYWSMAGAGLAYIRLIRSQGEQ